GAAQAPLRPGDHDGEQLAEHRAGALIPRLEKQLEQNRDEAAKAAKDEAGTVEKVLTAQVQGVKDLLLLLATLLPLAGGLGGATGLGRISREVSQRGGSSLIPPIPRLRRKNDG
ncbi:hypothetical protein, partial [Magnetospirillum moscoviense]|uniref:hypothetical protein n=1 Tax=Magnetospirillum moscoviense TaxID=1437059 RepID=UPI000A81DA14